MVMGGRLDESVAVGAVGPAARMSAVVRAMRPRQWVKNTLVLVAPLAAGGGFESGVLLGVLAAFVAFTLASSAIYLLNDARDVDHDRLHPSKRNRPIASGLVPVSAAYVLAVTLAVAALGVSLLNGVQLALVIAIYLVIQTA